MNADHESEVRSLDQSTSVRTPAPLRPAARRILGFAAQPPKLSRLVAVGVLFYRLYRGEKLLQGVRLDEIKGRVDFAGHVHLPLSTRPGPDDDGEVLQGGIAADLRQDFPAVFPGHVQVQNE